MVRVNFSANTIPTNILFKKGNKFNFDILCISLFDGNEMYNF